jgi:cellulose synthase/poly-beta-1,6-N-acetylglucosamine synthase-like glycosyltransferase
VRKARIKPPAAEAIDPSWKKDWPPLAWEPQPVRVEKLAEPMVRRVRVLIGVALVMQVFFLAWLLNPARWGDAWLYWPLAGVLVIQCLGWFYEWMNFGRLEVAPAKPVGKKWTVDVLTTACPGEPVGMILRTLVAMKKISYPHTSVLCDEGNDPILRAACAALGVKHVTREVKRNAKAGNVNNALEGCTGEIVVVLDPDHEPAPFLLDRTLGYFDDPEVGFVQSVQAYRNQNDSLVARGAAQETYLFYGPLMMGMQGYGTTQAIGANCVFRRAALDSIGGHAAGLAEDMHTSMRLYSKGWRSVYVPEILTRGLVPSSLSGYFKQQVKWACGSFDLLFQEYPKLAAGFTWWQRIHYFMGPLYFLRGAVSLVMILVPILSLLTGGVTFNMTWQDFLLHGAPLFCLVFLIRQGVQQWVLEPQERGFYLVGGLLNAAAWWVYLMGFLCAVFRVKIPYLPTPKEAGEEDWRLAIPNFVVIVVSLVAIVVGLRHDFTPFSISMALFAWANITMLAGSMIVGYQTAIHRCLTGGKLSALKRRAIALYQAERKMHDPLLDTLRNSSVAIAAVVVLIVSGWQIAEWRKSSQPLHMAKTVYSGGFYVGLYDPVADTGKVPASFHTFGQQLGANMRIYSMYQAWGPESITRFPMEALQEVRKAGSVPMITWEPWSGGFNELAGDPELFQNRRVYAGILRGDFDNYLKAYALKMREYGGPVLLRFAHEFDNPAYPWSPAGGNTPAEFKKMWVHVVNIFNQNGASNVGWVWNPWSPEAVEKYYPGDDYVDWVGLTALNYGQASSNRKWYGFGQLYQPYREKLAGIKKPVMLAEFGSTPYGGDQQQWLKESVEAVAKDYPEIRALVFFWSAVDKNWVTKWRPKTGEATIQWTFDPKAVASSVGPALTKLTADNPVPRNRVVPVASPQRSNFFQGEPGSWKWMVDGKPYFVRGVAYNPGHDWRDGNVPVTRRRVDLDFQKIREMGANTIRRYGVGSYDYNISKSAKEHDLKVLFGFWFDQDLDYSVNSAKLRAYRKQVEKTVRKYKDDPTILAWGLGNEVWGLLKHHYAQPHLTEVRHAYVEFVEELAKEIHAIDPSHPVFVAHEAGDHISGTLADFATGAPSVDFTAINAYYDPQLGQLKEATAKFDPARPYLVSEFGPDGYWYEDLTPRDAQRNIVEEKGAKKAALYADRWTRHIQPQAGWSLGGVAYCWRDRMEATSTWFGMTDGEGRFKAPYFALRRLWTGKAEENLPRISQISGPSAPLAPGSRTSVQVALDAQGSPVNTWKWRVEDDQFAPVTGLIDEGNTPGVITLTAPRKPGVYRLYVSAIGGAGVDEANLPFVVSKP